MNGVVTPAPGDTEFGPIFICYWSWTLLRSNIALFAVTNRKRNKRKTEVGFFVRVSRG